MNCIKKLCIYERSAIFDYEKSVFGHGMLTLPMLTYLIALSFVKKLLLQWQKTIGILKKLSELAKASILVKKNNGTNGSRTILLLLPHKKNVTQTLSWNILKIWFQSDWKVMAFRGQTQKGKKLSLRINRFTLVFFFWLAVKRGDQLRPTHYSVYK